MAIDGVHHINLVVRDLEQSLQVICGIDSDLTAIYDELPGRGVLTARVKLGDTWLVLLQPTNADHAPGQFLRDKGEGVFLVSLATSDLKAHAQRNNGLTMAQSGIRRGLDNWHVWDIDTQPDLGVQLQLCEES